MNRRSHLLEVTDLVKAFASPDGESTTIIDIPRFALAPEEHVAIRGAALQSLAEVAPAIADLLHGYLKPDSGVVARVATRARRDTALG